MYSVDESADTGHKKTVPPQRSGDTVWGGNVAVKHIIDYGQKYGCINPVNLKKSYNPVYY